MDTNDGMCWYTTQGTYVCRDNKNMCSDNTIEEFITVKPSPGMMAAAAAAEADSTKVYYKCNTDDDCMDPMLSCRVVPTTVNTNMKLCMQNGTHYYMKWPNKPPY